MHTIIIAMALALASPAFAQSEVAGICRVVDGDTVFAGSVEVRLQGVAAPEFNKHKKEPGGLEAATFMGQICEGQQVRCALDGSKTRGREVGICYVGEKDIGAEVIAAGLARDCPRYSKGRYEHLEKASASKLPYPGYCVLPTGRNSGILGILLAHGGGLNQCGCHFNRKTMECHCHRPHGCGCACQPATCPATES